MPRHRHFHLALPALALTSSAFALAQPAHAIAAPQRVEVRNTASSADVRWSAVSGATSYAVEVSEEGIDGPWRRWTTSNASTAVDIPFSAHPYRHSQGSYRYKVVALSADGSAVRSVVGTKPQGSAVSAVSW